MLGCKNIPLVRSIFGLDERSSYMRAPLYTVFDINILFAIFISAIGKNLRQHAVLLFVYKADALQQAEHISWQHQNNHHAGSVSILNHLSKQV